MQYKSLWVEELESQFRAQVIQRDSDDLAAGDVLVRVQYSCLNYKDALSATGNRGVTRKFPHQPGIDAAGVVAQSHSSQFKPGDEVIVTGFDLGMNTAGGLGQYIRVPAAWLVAKPEGISLAQSMLFGTAGLTALLCINKLKHMGLRASDGEVLVTGASGGVGSFAVALLASEGFQVVASTGKLQQHEYLRQLGATSIIDRQELSQISPKPLLKERFSAAIDVAGGHTLSNVLKQIKASGSVAICGLVESASLDTTVLPFIIRGVNLLGVDSVEISLEEKQQLWMQLASFSDYSPFETLNKTVSLEDVPSLLKLFLQGGITGHYRVSLA